jgi:FkbM family methyltransferase
LPDIDQTMTRKIIGDNNIANSNYEIRIRNAILNYIPIRNTFIDVGANVGVWSFGMYKHFNRVVAYEPSPMNIECFEANFELAQKTGVLQRGADIELRAKAVGDTNAEVSFRDSGKNCGNNKIIKKETSKSYKVVQVTLDDDLSERVSLIKIDVQGYELQTIKGAIRTIEKNKAWVAHEVNQDVDIICSIMEKLGYEMIIVSSKRMFIWAPTTGRMAPLGDADSVFGRVLGPGPYAERYGLGPKLYRVNDTGIP